MAVTRTSTAAGNAGKAPRSTKPAVAAVPDPAAAAPAAPKGPNGCPKCAGIFAKELPAGATIEDYEWAALHRAHVQWNPRSFGYRAHVAKLRARRCPVHTASEVKKWAVAFAQAKRALAEAKARHTAAVARSGAGECSCYE